MTPLVVDGWVVGFAREPGKNVDYRAGRSLLHQATDHITAGRCANDRAVIIGQGLANGYVPRDPSCGPGAAQHAQIDSVTFGCCEWNHVCTSLEVEAIDMATPFTAYQIDRCGLWVAACISVGIRDVNLVPAGGRFALGTDLRGFVDHRYLTQRACAMHSDGWNQWAEIRAAADKYLGGSVPTPGQRKKASMGLAFSIDKGKGWYVTLDAGSWLLGVTIDGQKGWYLVYRDTFSYVPPADAEVLKAQIPWTDRGTKTDFDRVAAAAAGHAPLVYVDKPLADQLRFSGMPGVVEGTQELYDRLTK